jgi:hypothetical protein
MRGSQASPGIRRILALYKYALAMQDFERMKQDRRANIFRQNGQKVIKGAVTVEQL